MSNHSVIGRGAGAIQQLHESDLKPAVQFDAELASEMIKRTEKMNDVTLDLAMRLKSAREFISWSASHMKASWLDWQTECSKAVQDLNLDRMAFDRESKTIVGAAKDVRDFFNSPEYQSAHASLKEMVGLLEKFGQLKQNGTLDAFADFILKVNK